MPREYFLLKGQDKLMNVSLEQRISNTISCCIKVDEEITPDIIHTIIVKRMKRILRNNEKHYLKTAEVYLFVKS